MFHPHPKRDQDDYERYFRQSETEEQREYERELLKRHYPKPLHPVTGEEHDEDIHANGVKGVDHDKPSTKDKVKGFWKTKVTPAISRVKEDIGIIRNFIHVERKVKDDMVDIKCFPEIMKVAEVRRGLDLCLEERRYVDMRKRHTRDAFAKFMGINPAEIHPDDVPTVGLGGSGGGFRAMIGLLGYMQEMKHSGLWDLITYVAGVSGACWALGAYYTYGDVSTDKVLGNFKERLSPHHPLSPDAIRKLLTVPDGAYVTLGPLAQKHHSKLHTVAMDLYSVFATGYVFLHHDPPSQQDVAGHQHSWYKWTSARDHLMDGREPLPLITAIRHERPWKDWEDKNQPFKEPDQSAIEHKNAGDAWFQWFEMTPFEVGCDELEAWVPTWGFGRPFERGRSTVQLPEQSLSLLLGLATGAPAGPLSSYISTIKRQLPTGFIGDAIENVASTIAHFWGKQGTAEFENHHPLHASNEHNYMFHLTHIQPHEKYPPGIENSPRIHLVDSGMDNNCPTYVLLHPRREADVVINMDASSDVQKDTFQERVDQIGLRRGIKFTRRDPKKAGADEKDPNRFEGLYAQLYDGKLVPRPEKVVDSYGNNVTNPPAPTCYKECTMIYMPLLPNEKAVPGYDPSTAKFSGSYNLVWTPEQIEMLVNVSVQNVRDGADTIKMALHEAWLRKRDLRMKAQSGQGQQGGQGMQSLQGQMGQMNLNGQQQQQQNVPSGPNAPYQGSSQVPTPPNAGGNQVPGTGYQSLGQHQAQGNNQGPQYPPPPSSSYHAPSGSGANTPYQDGNQGPQYPPPPHSPYQAPPSGSNTPYQGQGGNQPPNQSYQFPPPPQSPYQAPQNQQYQGQGQGQQFSAPHTAPPGMAYQGQGQSQGQGGSGQGQQFPPPPTAPYPGT